MNRTRNPNATCGNCPYWELYKSIPIHNDGTYEGACHLDTDRQNQQSDYYCSHHPDFWQDDAPATDREQQLRAAMERLVEATTNTQVKLVQKAFFSMAWDLDPALDAAKEVLYD